MKAFLIDAKAREIREVDFAPVDDLEAIQAAVGGELGKVYVEKCLFRWLPGDCILADEDARVRAKPLRYGFAINGNSRMLMVDDRIVGNGVVFRASPDESGGWQSPLVSLEALRAMVSWWAE